MSGFKVGDKIVSTMEDSPNLYIKKGSTYTVSKVRPSGCVALEEIAARHSYDHQNFELAPQVNKFKVGDTVRCINDGGYSITVGKLYTIKVIAGEFLRVTDDLGNVGGYRYTRFELAQEPVLTPEEVFKHLREGTKLEFRQKGTGSTWSRVTNGWCVQLLEICNDEWRIKPVPEIIESFGRKYKLIEE